MKEIREFIDLTNFTSDNFLAINNCGYVKYQSQQTILRTKGRKDYHIIYVTKGKCVALADGKEEVLEAGSVLFYRPDEKQLYSYEKDSLAYWIHFTGKCVEEIFSKLINKRIIKTEADCRLTEIFQNIINNFEAGDTNLLSISYLIQFCIIADNIGENNKALDMRIENVKRYMNENYSKNHPLDFYADMCNLSTTRFSHLFREITGVSPHRYLIDIRMRQIKYLLMYSHMNISEIAHAVGFDDPLYMSRLFSKYEGVSPLKMRKG